MGYAEDDPVAQTRFAAFKEGLAALGWVEGKNLKMEVRWSAGDPSQASVYAKELVALVRANPNKYTFSSSGTGAVNSTNSCDRGCVKPSL